MQIQRIFYHLTVLLTGCLFALAPVSAQQVPKARYATLSVFNAATQLPLGQFFSRPMHLGAVAGMEFRYNRHASNQWFQTAKLGFSHHRYVQSSIQLYSELGYRRSIWRGIGAELRLGGGYLHAIPATEIFTLKGNAYEKKRNFGRPQLMTGGALGLSYTRQKREKPLRFMLDYQFYLQLPFVKQYVTLLPNTLLHAGVAAPLSIF